MSTYYVSVRRKAIVNNKKNNRRRPVFDLRKEPGGAPVRVPAGRYMAPVKEGAALSATHTAAPEGAVGTVMHGYIRFVYDTKNTIGGNGKPGPVVWLEITETPPGVVSTGQDVIDAAAAKKARKNKREPA